MNEKSLMPVSLFFVALKIKINALKSTLSDEQLAVFESSVKSSAEKFADSKNLSLSEREFLAKELE